MSDFITDVDSCLIDAYRKKNTKQLTEDKAKMAIEINATGKHSIYSFDSQPDPFPFFSQRAKLRQVSDYVIFCVREKDETPFALIIELKSQRGKGIDQLKATQQFVEFLIQRINVACHTGHKPETRKIEISKCAKGYTKPSKVIYNAQGITYITGDKLVIADYLKE